MRAKQTGSQSKFIWALARLSRKFWRVKGWDKILRMLYHPDRRSADHFSMAVPYDDDLLIHVDTASFLEWTILFKNYYEPSLVQLYKRLVKTGMSVIDVGANVGCHTLLFSKLVTQIGNVIAIEPNPEVADRLEANCCLNKIDNVRLFRLACAQAEKETGFLVASNTSIKTAYLRTENVLDSEFNSSKILNVNVTTLDQVFAQSELTHCEMIKIDVDGGEYDVLLGGERILNDFHPYLLFEYSPSNYTRSGVDPKMVLSFLQHFDYRLYYIEEFRGHFSHLSPFTENRPDGNLLAVSYKTMLV